MSDDDLIRREDALDAMFKGPRTVQERIDAIRAIPAAHVTVKPGEIERSVWSAMIWAADNNPGFNGVPEYTDGGNGFAETECRATAARIRSDLTAQPSPDVAALVAALRDALLWTADYEDRAGWRAKARAAIARVKGGEA